MSNLDIRPTYPEASVIIAAFNAENTLSVQLGALSSQDAAFEWEVVVCDNGSTDGTAALVTTWQRRMPRLRLVDASGRRGAGAARNIGAERADGAALIFCDADDAVTPGWLSAMCRALSTHPAAAGGRRYDLLNAAAHGPFDWTDPLFTTPALPGMPAGSSSNLGIRRDIFAEVGGFDELLRAGEDLDLCWRIQLAGHELAPAPDAIVQIRRREGLRAVFRQSYAYGAADRVLRHKYAQVHPTRVEGVSSSGAMPASEGEHDVARPLGFFSRARRALARRRLPELAFATDRWAHRLGYRFAKVPAEIAQVEDVR